MLRIGGLVADPPVVLAPMAGVTNAAFRSICQRYGGGLFVSEMVSARGLVERSEKSAAMVAFPGGDAVRSVQIYGVDPATVGGAVRIVVDELGAEHVDLNFGCPVPKVTRKGGGAAVPAHPVLLGNIVAAAVAAAGSAPVTVKMRMGLDDERPTAIPAALAAEANGAAAVTLHARTAEQHYSGSARWTAIAELKAAMGIPVLGNGDIWHADDAVRMMRETGCDGVVIGRGCLGRPWFFGELEAALTGRPAPPSPDLLGICDIVGKHATLLAADAGERSALLEMRKHFRWYFHDAELGSALRAALVTTTTLGELHDVLAKVGESGRLPDAPARPRGPSGGPRRVALPEGWLDRAVDPTPPEDDGEAIGG